MDNPEPIKLATKVENRILLIRGHKVMLDEDLAPLYGVPAKVLNQAVKRNLERFPADFMFQLTQDEFLDVMFEDLELPNLVKRHLKGADSFKRVHAGFTHDGVPAKLNVVRSLRVAKARRGGRL